MDFTPTPNLKIKRYGSSVYLYDSLQGNIIKAEAEIEVTLDQLKHGHWEDGYENKLWPLIENGLLRRNEQTEQKIPHNSSSAGELYNLRFHVSNRCNHDCRYCHVFGNGDSGSDQPLQMDYRIMKTGLDAYAQLTEGRNNQALEFSFYGGEPLFNWPAIKLALSYGNRLLREKRQVTWILNTNGTMITPGRAQTLSREGVDVHLSIDGPDDFSNQNRRYKSGRPVLKTVLNALDTLKQFDCQVQFDTCLTKANGDQLESLIDLAADKGVDRIYLALTDEAPALGRDSLSTREIARLLVNAMVYGERQGVVVGGPWKCFYPWLLPKTATMVSPVPHLIVDTSGEFYLPAFSGQKLGPISQIHAVLASGTYAAMLQKQEDIRVSCRGCELEGICGGYLKGMVRYHTGSLHGHERECGVARSAFDEYLRYLADQKTEHITPAISVTDTSLLEEPLIHSRHLKVERDTHRFRLSHGLSGKVVEVSTDMLEFIDAFKNAARPASLLERYHIPNLLQIVQMLLRNHVLIPATRDEELEHLNRKMSSSTKKSYETTDCLCLYSPGDRILAEKFALFFQELYPGLKAKFKPLRQKLIIYVAEKREELAQFWFEPALPPWINGFVALHRILVVDINKIKNDDWRTARFNDGMTHEIIHMLLGNLNLCLPIWLEEGICEYFSKSDPTPNLLNLMKKKKLLPFKELEAKATHTLLDIDNSKTDDNICYHQAHSFVTYLCESFGEDEFISWIGTLGLNSELEHGFAEYFENSLADLEQKWLHNLRSLNHQKI